MQRRGAIVMWWRTRCANYCFEF